MNSLPSQYSNVNFNFMPTLPTKILILLLLTLISCNSRSDKYTPLISKDETNENENQNHLIAFVGEKIEVKEIPYEPGDFDAGFIAKYKVLQMVYGNYTKDTIEFEASDHYGTPPFSEYKNVLLFVVEDEGKYYHEKYMYNDVYITRSGKWAGSYAGGDYGHEFNYNTTVKPQKINFLEEVSYNIEGRTKEEAEIIFPKPYYKISRDKAIAVYGNYIEELFRLKKEGFLTARKLF